jgi:putative lipoprotein (rSAM/lipoprotein system)
MKKSLIKSFDKIIVVLLAILRVFNSCSQPDEYGTPYADYELKGVVTDKETSKPIKNIRVIHQTYRDTTYTDAEGKYAFIYDNNLLEYLDLKIEDIDGEENDGYFAAQEMDVIFTETDKVKKGKGWYSGKYVKTQNIELEKK